MSNQCMALVRDNCLVPTKDAHELGYIRESSDKQYVPDVFYKVGNKLFSSFFSFLFITRYFPLIHHLYLRHIFFYNKNPLKTNENKRFHKINVLD